MTTPRETKTVAGLPDATRSSERSGAVTQALQRAKPTTLNSVNGIAASPARGTHDRNLGNGLPPFSSIREFAAFLRVHPRTIARDIDDGLLAANEIRGARRISRADGLAYLRMTRNIGGRKRRRSSRQSKVHKARDSS